MDADAIGTPIFDSMRATSGLEIDIKDGDQPETADETTAGPA